MKIALSSLEGLYKLELEGNPEDSSLLVSLTHSSRQRGQEAEISLLELKRAVALFEEKR